MISVSNPRDKICEVLKLQDFGRHFGYIIKQGLFSMHTCGKIKFLQLRIRNDLIQDIGHFRTIPEFVVFYPKCLILSNLLAILVAVIEKSQPFWVF